MATGTQEMEEKGQIHVNTSAPPFSQTLFITT